MGSTAQADAARTAVELGFVDPTAEAVDAGLTAAPRIASLHGKTAGLLDNRKGNGDKLLGHIGTLLTERYGVDNVHMTSKFVYARRATDEVLDEMAANCDFVVTAVGD